MKIRYGITGILFIGTLFLTASQVAFVNTVSATSPITSPITGPVVTPTPTTSPITPPVPTLPVATPTPIVVPTVTPTAIPTPTVKPSPTPTPIKLQKYKVSGRAQYSYPYYTPVFKSGRIYTYTVTYKIAPVSNIKVKAINKITKKITTTKTNFNGEYSFVLDRGIYTIDVIGNTYKSFYNPKINLNLVKNTTGLNFYTTR